MNRKSMLWPRGFHSLATNAIVLGMLFVLVWSCRNSKNTDSDGGYTWKQFVMGSDLSYVNVVEKMGGVYKENGQPGDPFRMLAGKGNNTCRVRLWHQPIWQQGLNEGYVYSNLADVEKTMRRAKEAGMAVNLDLHYSDRWADPDHQEIPAAWQGLGLTEMADSVYNYTLGVLNHLADKNLIPEMIQIGNETNQGMLWPLGKTTSGFANFSYLLQSGIQAVRDFSKNAPLAPKIILHVAQLQNSMSWADSLKANKVLDYDILGLSHYYKWSTVTNWDSISGIIQLLKSRTGKEIMVVETAFPFTNENADGYNNILWEPTGAAAGYPFSEEGQLSYYTDLTRAIVKGGGKGIMIWEPGWITSRLNDGWNTGSSWENNAFWQFGGNLHSGVSFMKKQYDIQ